MGSVGNGGAGNGGGGNGGAGNGGGSNGGGSNTLAALQPAGASPLEATEGAVLAATPATLVDATPQSRYAASIDWGDGSAPTLQTISNPDLSTSVAAGGSHVYAEEGTYTVAVTFSDANGRSAAATAPVVVADAPLSGTGVDLAATTNVAFTGEVADFRDGDPLDSTGDYSAQIAWGDGQTSTGSIAVDPNDPTLYDVTGTNTYATPGTFSASVTILHGSLAPLALGFTAKVEPLPPIITGGWGGWVVDGNAPNYVTAGDPGVNPGDPSEVDRLPIGAVPTLTVQAPAGFTIVPGSIEWSGLTTVYNYLSAPADSAPAATQNEPDFPTPTDQASYTFIVQAATPGSSGDPYDIEVSCKYVEDPTGKEMTSHVKFTSDPPALASLKADISPVIQNYIDPTTGNAIVQLAKQQNPETIGPAASGIQIKADTRTDAFPGRFMFLQVLDPTDTDYLRARENNPRTVVVTNAPNPGFGFNHDGQHLGYELVPPNANALTVYDWEIPDANTPKATQSMVDSPDEHAPPNQWDRMAAGDPKGGDPKAYTTYLMYRPEGTLNRAAGPSVWVALAKVTWSWGESVSINPDGTSMVLHTDTPTAEVSSAVGAWPTWTGLASRRVDTQQQFVGENPWP